MTFGRFDIGFGWRKYAGLICLGWRSVELPNGRFRDRDYSLHLLVRPHHWCFGFSQDEFEFIHGLGSFGFGPFFLLCWMEPNE